MGWRFQNYEPQGSLKSGRGEGLKSDGWEEIFAIDAAEFGCERYFQQGKRGLALKWQLLEGGEYIADLAGAVSAMVFCPTRGHPKKLFHPLPGVPTFLKESLAAYPDKCLFLRREFNGSQRVAVILIISPAGLIR
jgi:hypothetical protein